MSKGLEGVNLTLESSAQLAVMTFSDTQCPMGLK